MEEGVTGGGDEIGEFQDPKQGTGDPRREAGVSNVPVAVGLKSNRQVG